MPPLKFQFTSSNHHQQRFTHLYMQKSNINQYVETPLSIADMMGKVAISIIEAKKMKIPIALVEVPLPVTGGTELDDWPGGIQQKYSTILPMLKETLIRLNFSNDAINQRNFLGPYGPEDAIGFWEHNKIGLCIFPTSDTISTIIQMQPNYDILIIINQQFFLDPLSKDASKEFLFSLPYCYILENLLMKGPDALPIRGLLYRQYPGPYKACRRMEDGSGYILLKTYEYGPTGISSDRSVSFNGTSTDSDSSSSSSTSSRLDVKPSRKDLEDLFFEDSKVRDKDLSFFERLKRQIPRA